MVRAHDGQSHPAAADAATEGSGESPITLGAAGSVVADSAVCATDSEVTGCPAAALSVLQHLAPDRVVRVASPLSHGREGIKAAASSRPVVPYGDLLDLGPVASSRYALSVAHLCGGRAPPGDG